MSRRGLLLALAVIAGCRDEGDGKLDPLMPMLDRMCGCHDKACGDAAATAYQAWFAAHADGQLDSRQSERFDQIVGAMEACRAKAGGPSSMVP